MKKSLFIISLLFSFLTCLLIFSCGSSSISKGKNDYSNSKKDYELIINLAKLDSANITLAAERYARNIVMEASAKADKIVSEAKKSATIIKKKELITKLESKVMKIPVSKYKENLDIYKELYELDPENERYKRKVAFYEDKLEQQKQKEELKISRTNSHKSEKSVSSSTSSLSTSKNKRISGNNWFGCTDRKYFNKLVEYVVQQDEYAFNQAFAAGLLTGICTKFKNGEIVYIVDTAIFSGLVKVRRRGQTNEYWTNIEAVK